MPGPLPHSILCCCGECLFRCPAGLNIETVTVPSLPQITPTVEQQDNCETCLSGTVFVWSPRLTYSSIDSYPSAVCTDGYPGPQDAEDPYLLPLDLCIADMYRLWNCCSSLGEIIDVGGTIYRETITETQAFSMCLGFYVSNAGVSRVRIGVALTWQILYKQINCNDSPTGCNRCEDDISIDENGCEILFNDQGGTCPWTGPGGLIAQYATVRKYWKDVSCSELMAPIDLDHFSSSYEDDLSSSNIPGDTIYCFTLPESNIVRCEPCLYYPTLRIQFGT